MKPRVHACRCGECSSWWVEWTDAGGTLRSWKLLPSWREAIAAALAGAP